MPTEIIKCPDCGKEVEHKTHDGHDLGLYEEVEATAIEKKVEARLGIPFRHMIKHKCPEPCMSQDEHPYLG